MSNQQTVLLAKLLTEYSDLPIRMMYLSEGSSDHLYTSGNIKNVIVMGTWEDDDRVYFEDEEDEIKEFIFDSLMYEQYPEIAMSRYLHLTDEQTAQLEKEADIEFAKIQWAKEIIIYVE